MAEQGDEGMGVNEPDNLKHAVDDGSEVVNNAEEGNL